MSVTATVIPVYGVTYMGECPPGSPCDACAQVDKICRRFLDPGDSLWCRECGWHLRHHPSN